MAFADGWVCRACWKPNRQRDTRCYVCKVPRGADSAAVETERKAREAAKLNPRPESAPDWLVALPVVVFNAEGWVWRVLAIVLAILAVPVGVIVGFAATIVLLVIAAIGYVLGRVYPFLATNMRERRLWAFVLGLLLSGPPGASIVSVAASWPGRSASAPPPDALQVFMDFLWLFAWIEAVAFEIAAVAALIGLILSIVRPAVRFVTRRERASPRV